MQLLQTGTYEKPSSKTVSQVLLIGGQGTPTGA
jgi:hypothetical protein